MDLLSTTKQMLVTAEGTHPCRCGCGQEIHVRDAEGRNRYFIRGHNMVNERGPANRNWRGGRLKDGPYIRVSCPGHPRGHKTAGYVFEHILVMEKHLGRYISPSEDVHHINGIKDDNRIENLQLFSHGGHTKLHRPHTFRRSVR